MSSLGAHHLRKTGKVDSAERLKALTGLRLYVCAPRPFSGSRRGFEPSRLALAAECLGWNRAAMKRFIRCSRQVCARALKLGRYCP